MLLEQAGALNCTCNHSGGEWRPFYLMVSTLYLFTGGDATESFEDVGHSPDARTLQKDYRIGRIANPQVKR